MFEELFADRGLSLDRLRALLEVQQAGSIAQAAPGDPGRQSQYSRQLRELSEFFGASLTQRRGKELKLSADGERLAGIARAHFQSLHDLRSDCLAQEADYRLAAGDSLLQWLVIPRLQGTRFAKLRVRFSTFNLRTNDIVTQLSDGRLDFGLVRADAVTAELHSSPLGTLTYRLVVPQALTSSGRTTLRQALTQVPLVAQTGDGQFSQRLCEIALEAGAELRPRLTCQSFPQSLAAVRGGGHGAILPSIALHELNAADIRVIDAVALRRLDRAMALVWHPRVLRLRTQASEVRDALTRAFAF
ncbi:MAG: LysR family transcriptional regulator [Vicinamibacterales bacterium]